MMVSFICAYTFIPVSYHLIQTSKPCKLTECCFISLIFPSLVAQKNCFCLHMFTWKHVYINVNGLFEYIDSFEMYIFGICGTSMWPPFEFNYQMSSIFNKTLWVHKMMKMVEICNHKFWQSKMTSKEFHSWAKNHMKQLVMLGESLNCLHIIDFSFVERSNCHVISSQLKNVTPATGIVTKNLLISSLRYLGSYQLVCYRLTALITPNMR